MSIPASGAKWPLTGGLPSQLSTSKDHVIKRVYLTGYADGSVRIWDATYPVLSFVYHFEYEVRVLYLFVFICTVLVKNEGVSLKPNHLMCLTGGRY